MKNFLLLISLSLVITISYSTNASVVIYPNFEIPPEFKSKPDFNPSRYLAKYPVADINKKLSNEKKERLACLIVASEKYTQEKFKHSFMVDLKQPLIALTMTNFPQIRAMEWGGRKDANVKYMSLSQIAKGVESVVNPSNCKV
ncbi:hypothetical protein [Kangiella sp. HZ709]|uniref:hypothetical protein n=1 Tax=Kangiella sp. HZ709 TaxID=2666328 RepID=UPI0012B1553D|nr:hypothetical protein [Kangiella sp. HZ709]MRX27800.1 hypothetical protein [Kangiella sp. HZ709]